MNVGCCCPSEASGCLVCYAEGFASGVGNTINGEGLIGCTYTVASGAYVIIPSSPYGLLENNSGSYLIAQSTTSHPSQTGRGRIRATGRAATTGNGLRMLWNMEHNSSENYDFLEVKRTNSSEFTVSGGIVTGGADTINYSVAVPTVGLVRNFEICVEYYDENVAFFVTETNTSTDFAAAFTQVPNASTQYVGFAILPEVSNSAQLWTYAFSRYKTELDENGQPCGDGCGITCTCCPSGDAPIGWLVDMGTSFNNSGYYDATHLNGEKLLELDVDYATCSWAMTEATGLYRDPDCERMVQGTAIYSLNLDFVPLASGCLIRLIADAGALVVDPSDDCEECYLMWSGIIQDGDLCAVGKTLNFYEGPDYPLSIRDCPKFSGVPDTVEIFPL